MIGSSEASPEMLDLAEAAGAVVARVGAALVTGGRCGIMETASKGCAAEGGVVIGVTPHTGMNEINPYAHYHIPTGMGWARNAITGIAGDVVVVIGGSSGTLSEIAFAWMYDRPIIALSSAGGWAERVAGQTLDHRRDDTVVDCPDIADFENVLRQQLARSGFGATQPSG